MIPVFKPAAARAGVVAALAASAGILLLTFAVTQGYTAGFDRLALESFTALRGPLMDGFFLAGTWFGSSYVLLPAALLTIVALIARRQWAAARLLGLTYFGASLTTWWLKTAVGRDRPDILPMLLETRPADLSFPSGHATHAAAFALALWLLTARHRPRLRIPAGIVLSALVLMVAVSRLHLQVHWPSDVIAGLLVATLWAGLATAYARHVQAEGIAA
ncbi:MAG: phosphatase PAP2 family protein [Gammaproteobacteria bacterium]|nr:phosphatase PAP2 family protein [Rhodocyclaceae bacterium]MBU3909078.1 phosphatase PAP2 family protein [Gammaproteobacteria bacterium]MBU3989063.1 phosphatase PAP2 family protein [Gammaproteobacteria bacterium]MBU4003289.1 phosphatase PAP2 family protein [Gammaproteobacteria bacterium]MBU4022121.1 phosphatase PAP2 family protein [Gammaproteobacteria bacterium]